MGRKSVTGGVYESRGKVQIRFMWNGKQHSPVLKMEWSERNRKLAVRMVQDIKEKIRHGIFNPSDYYGSERGEAGRAALPTFQHYADLFLLKLGQKASATQNDYRKQLAGVWSPRLGERPIVSIRYSELEEIVGGLGVAAKTLNNYLIPLRGVFAYAKKDGAIQNNPAEGLENAKTQQEAPDPLEREEIELVLADLREHEHEQVANYFAALMFAGFRPSECVALKWADVDFRRRTVLVHSAVVSGKKKETTKTYKARTVELSERAWAAFEAQRKHTQLADKEVFYNPNTGAAWGDIQCQWRVWERSLQRCKLRYRVPYQCRHTYASQALTAGANPAYIARQLGHVNAKMLFEVYAVWIDEASNNGRERERLSAAQLTPTEKQAAAA